MNHETEHTHTEHTHEEPSSGRFGKDFPPGGLGQWFNSIVEWLMGPPKQHPHPLQYFLPGKILLHVRHLPGIDAIKLADLITPASLGALGTQQLRKPDPQAILTFPLQDSQGFIFSLVPAELIRPTQENVVALLVDIYNQLRERPIQISADVSVRAVSPNWLLGSASHAPHPPSPGSWPVPAPAPTLNESKFSLLDKSDTSLSELPFTNTDGAGIDVAILDTAPAELDLEEAYEKWHTSSPQFESLLAPNTGKLHVYTGIQTDIELMEYSPAGHRYEMSSHGLSVASAIHAIAPQASLHLIKVFTPYGTASTQTIAQGLLKLLQIFRDPLQKDRWRPLIVNCSFSLSLREPGHDGVPGPAPTDFPVELWNPQILRHLNTSLREFFSTLAREENVVIVAAAGNDSDANGRKSTSYPAAYEEVLGVGASPKVSSSSTSYTAASYSNLADDQNPSEGFVTFGGEPGPGNGVRGMFISEIPVYVEGFLSFLWRILTGTGLDGWNGPGHIPPNPRALTLSHIRYKLNHTGWAWWAGTSFATPIIAGILAVLWSGPRRGTPLDCGSAETELNDHFKGRTGQGERVIHIEQG